MYFNRNTIKKTIMTTPYSAGENTCWKYFKEEVIKEFSLKEEELEKIHDIYKIFYNFVRDFFEEIHLFKNPSKAIIKHFKEVAEKEKKIVLNVLIKAKIFLKLVFVSCFYYIILGL
jgi:hypothetical protein